MHVDSLELNYYRNYRKLSIELDQNLNIFVGDNAQGKTNLIESIYLLATGRSHRTFRDTDLITWNAPEAQVRAQVNTQMGSFSMRVLLSRNRRKRFWIGGEELRRQSDLLGFLNVVLFSPDDLQLVKGSPSMRRHFIDLGLAQVSKVYRHDLVDYNRVLQQRNSLLKNIAERKAKVDELHLWDAQLVEYGTRLMYKRAEAIQRIAGFARESHKGISGGEENLTIHYLPFYLKEGESIAETKLPLAREINDRFAKELESNRLQELRRGTTLVGPQRDDLLFQIDGKDARQLRSRPAANSGIGH